MKRPLFMVCLAIVLLVAVFTWIHPPAFFSYGEAAGEEVYLTGRVYAKEYKKGRSAPVLSLYLKPDRLLYQNQSIPFEDNFICVMQNGCEEPAIGSSITVKGILTEFEPARNPGQFDARQYYAIQGISAQVRSGELMSRDEGQDMLLERLWCIKKQAGEALEHIFPGEDAQVLKAMLLGDKAFLSEETKALYREAGILHILAISGLHITVLGMGLYKLLRKLWLPLVPACLLAGGVMILYGIMVGMPVSAARAIFMFLLRLLADCVGRTYDMLTALALCGAGMLLSQPGYLFYAGFLLSYLAVLGIGLLKPVLVEAALACGGMEKLPVIADALLASLSIAVFTLPAQLYFYYEVSVYAVLFNLAVLPLAGYALGLGLSALAVFFLVPGLAELLAVPVHLVLTIYAQGADFLRTLPGSLWTPGKPEGWQLLGFALAVGLVMLCKKLEWKYRIGLLCGAVLVFGIHDRSVLNITFLDVGQGDCICVELPGGGTWLFDGGSTSVSSVGTYRIAPFLKSRGITVLNGIFLSHEDADHINGVEELLQEESIRTELLILPGIAKGDTELFAGILEAAAKKEIPVLWLEEGMTWERGGAKAVCLHPDGRFYAENANAASMVVYMTYGKFSMLLTGDVEEDGETALLAVLKERRIEDITVLKVAHHGSKNSTGDELLAQLRPELAVISCGRNNRYGHPHKELLDRLLACGTETMITFESGAVTVRTDGKRMEAEVYLGK